MGERIWIKARTGDWDCNVKEWRMGKGVDNCWACGTEYADLEHCILRCGGNREDRKVLESRLEEVWGEERWTAWLSMGEERKIAECLGLRGWCSTEQRSLVTAFLREMDRRGREGREEQVSGQRVLPWLRRVNGTEEGE